MIVATCQNKNRDLKGKIISYILVDRQCNKVVLDSKNLRLNMQEGNILVDNLKLSKDGHVIDKKIASDIAVISLKEVMLEVYNKLLNRLKTDSNMQVYSYNNRIELKHFKTGITYVDIVFNKSKRVYAVRVQGVWSKNNVNKSAIDAFERSNDYTFTVNMTGRGFETKTDTIVNTAIKVLKKADNISMEYKKQSLLSRI